MSCGGAVEDASLVVPAVPGLGRPLGSLSLAGIEPRTGPSELRGGDALAMVGRDGVTAHARGVPLFEGLRLADAGAIDPVATPLSAERRPASRGGPLERVVVPWAGPFVLVEWAGAAVSLELRWVVPQTGAGLPLRWRAAERGLVVDRGGERVLYALSTGAAIRVDDAADGAVRVTVNVAGPKDGVRLAATTLEGDPPTHPPRALARPARVVRARESTLRRLLDERLSVETADPAHDRELAWAVVSLAASEPAIGRQRVGPSPALARWADAELAIGAARAVRPLIRRWAETPTPRDASIRSMALSVILLARYHAWTGDRATTGSVWRRLEEVGAFAASATDTPLQRALLSAVVRLAEGIGREPPAGIEPPEQSDRAYWEGLAGALWDEGESAGARGPDDPAGPGGGAVGPDPIVQPDSAAASRIRRFVQRLGVVPDAALGRLALRPRLPDRCETLTVTGLRVGAAALDLGYRRRGSTTRIELRQPRGGVPLQVVLEPELAGPGVAAVRVDGASAALESVSARGRWRVPVQLVVDRPRTLEVEMEASAG